MRTPFFMTERETEDVLALETREVVLPDGSRRSLTEFKLMWSSFDRIVEKGLFTAPELASLAIMASNETGQPLERTFPNTVGYVAHRMRRMNEQLISAYKRLLGRS